MQCYAVVMLSSYMKIKAVWLEVQKPYVAGEQAEASYASVCLNPKLFPMSGGRLPMEELEELTKNQHSPDENFYSTIQTILHLQLWSTHDVCKRDHWGSYLF